MFSCLTEWFCLFCHPLKPLDDSGLDFRLICLNKSDTRFPLCKRYFQKIEYVDDISSISWTDLIMRRVRFVSFPMKRQIRTRTACLKRFLAKILGLGVGNRLAIRNFQDVLFFVRGKRILFASTDPVKELYKFHYREFRCFVLKDETSLLRLLPIVLIARLRRSVVVDNDGGVAVFTNTPSEWIIRAYRICHPKKTIVLRFHDCLNKISAQSKSQFRVVALADRLRRAGIVDFVESYSRRDAERLGAHYRPNAVDPDRLADIPDNFRQCLCFFRGAPGAGGSIDHRSKSLELLGMLLSKAYPGSTRWVDAAVVPTGANWMSYSQYLHIAIQSELAVDLYRLDPEEGFSFRLPEALWLRKKIITDRSSVLKETFYDKSRFFILGYDDPARFSDFLASDFKPLCSEQLSQFDARKYWAEQTPHSLERS